MVGARDVCGLAGTTSRSWWLFFFFLIFNHTPIEAFKAYAGQKKP
jgi:hypothetical protein